MSRGITLCVALAAFLCGQYVEAKLDLGYVAKQSFQRASSSIQEAAEEVRAQTQADKTTDKVQGDDDPVGYGIASPTEYTLLNSSDHGELYQVSVPDADGYDDTLFLLRLTGSHYEMGYDMATLFGQHMLDSMNALLGTLTEGHAGLQAAAEKLLKNQWQFLAKQTPASYLHEIQGLSDGSKAAGLTEDAGDVAAMGIVMANLPGDLDDLVYVFMDELDHQLKQEVEALAEMEVEQLLRRLHWLRHACSNFGAWGNRTANSQLYTGRNLDWEIDTGVTNHKVVTVFRPIGETAHATIGFAGIIGALTGMSADGVTVHEANLESDLDSFYGFPWTLRLREIMAKADTLEAAQAIWNTTNNTCGFNHGVGSAADSRFMIMETDAGHTAYFLDMDPREVDSTDGQPRPDAVFRTNHGYDSFSIAHYQWNGTGADADSRFRYALFPQVFDNITMGEYDELDAVRTAAVVASKGYMDTDFFHCNASNYPKANNVISAAFAPTPPGSDVGSIMYAAWEVGTGADWVPACCGSYIKFEMAKWW